jgi:uncharacterized protein YqgQ
MPLTQDQVFKRVTVDYSVKNVTRVEWGFRKCFLDPQPWVFTLQVNRNGGDEGTDWTDVGVPITNTFQAFDDEQRIYGKDMRIVYRVKLETAIDTYYSEPATVLGLLSKRQWLQARAIIRRHTIRPRFLTDFPGKLFKRKIFGSPCTDCVDDLTGGITNSDCEACNGTGIIDGYWHAVDNAMYDLSPEVHNVHRDNQLQRGTVNDNAVRGKFVALPMINRNDIWIDDASDRRFAVHVVQNTAEINQVPIICTAELRLLEFSNVAYSIPVEGS